MTTPEGRVVDHLKKRVKETGGEYRKVQWVARHSAPDALVWWPFGIHAYIECKRPKKAAEEAQKREHERMRKGGMLVFVASTIEEVDRVVDGLIASSTD